MFGNLIESGSHAADLKRKGRFFLGTTAFYILLFAATGVGSIYAYNARLDQPDDEYVLLSLMRFPPVVRDEPARRDEARPASNQSRIPQLTTRPEISVQTPYHEDRIADASTKEVRANTPVVIAPFTSDPNFIGGPVGTNTSGGTPNSSGRDIGPTVASTGEEAPVPTPAPTPQKPRDPVPLSTGVLAGKAISKPAPAYPAIAKQARIQGPVSVHVLIDERGNVVSAKATSGNPLLQNAAVQAAYQARFTPTLLSNQPVKVTGVITYNFLLQ